MTDSHPSVWEQYVRLELLPVYFGTVVVWVMTSAVRGVLWSLARQVWMVVSMNYSLLFGFVSRYQEVLRDPELNQLRGPSYIFALWNAFFAVPVQVLEEGSEAYGQYGLMLRSWRTAALITYGDFLPNLGLRTGAAYLAYVKATCDARAAVWHRTVAVAKGLCWIGLLCLSLMIHFLMAVFDLLEFLTFGTTGLAIILTLVNLLCYLTVETICVAYAYVVVVVVGIATHCWRFTDEQGRLRNAAPGAVVHDALQSVRAKVDECNQREATCLSNLRCAEPTPGRNLRPRRGYPADETTATLPMNPVTATKYPAPTAPTSDSRPPLATYPAATTTASTSTTTSRTTSALPTTSCAAHTLLDEDYITLTEEELRVVKCLRDMDRGRVVRGRTTIGRGVCPVPGNIACEPASVARYVPGPCPTSTTFHGQMT